jgi:hypothetical protein
MNMPAVAKKVASSFLLIALLGLSGALAGGCAYGGIAALPDGTVVLARNGLLGALRKIYICKVVGNALNCVESASAP